MHCAGKDSFHLGFDIGGTKCAVILGRQKKTDSRPEILAKSVFPTREFPRPASALSEALRRANELAGHLSIHSIGVSCGGPLHSGQGVILSPPNLPGWDRVPITRILSDALGAPANLQNDANACALAEWRWGAAAGAQTAIFLTFGTGLGAGLIIGGRLYEGRDDLAGEVGHWRLDSSGPEGYGKKGSWEGFCSGFGMAEMLREKVRAAWAQGMEFHWCRNEMELASLSVVELSALARGGNEFASEIFVASGQRLGQGLSLLIDLLNPETIVVGSIFARCEDLLRTPMEDILRKECLPTSLMHCSIKPAALAESVGDYAALAVATNVRS